MGAAAAVAPGSRDRAIPYGPVTDPGPRKDSLYSLFDKSIRELRSNTGQYANVIRFVGYTANFAEQFAGKVTLLTNITTKLVGVADFLDCALFMRDMHYWSNKSENGKHGFITKLSFASFGAVTVGCVGLLLDHLKFVDLAKIAAGIGEKLPLLKIIVSIPLGIYVRGALAVGYGGMTIKSIFDVCNATNDAQKRQAWIDVAYCSSQCALNVLFTAGYAINPWIAGLGMLAYGLGLGSHLHGHFNSKALDEGKITFERGIV